MPFKNAAEKAAWRRGRLERQRESNRAWLRRVAGDAEALAAEQRRQDAAREAREARVAAAEERRRAREARRAAVEQAKLAVAARKAARAEDPLFDPLITYRVARARNAMLRARQRHGRSTAITAGELRRLFLEGIGRPCPCCGRRMVLGANVQQSISLDRLDSTKGYESGNVAVICARCNRIKSDGTAWEHERIAAYIRARLPAQAVDEARAEG